MKRHCAGFTLVEVIASLLIVGILGAIAGMGIVTGMRGYMQAKENGHLAKFRQELQAKIGDRVVPVLGITGTGRMRKSQLVEAISAALNAASERAVASGATPGDAYRRQRPPANGGSGFGQAAYRLGIRACSEESLSL